MSGYTPAALTALVQRFVDDIPGVHVETEQRSPNRWRLTASTDRVRVWADYEPLSRGRLDLKGSQLFLDGQMVPRVNSYHQLVQMFADPDSGGQPETNAEALARAEIVEVSQAPAVVQETLRKFEAKLRGHKGLKVEVRHVDWRWYICLGDGVFEMTMLYAEYGLNHERPMRDPGVGPAAGNWITLVIDGVDYTDKVADNVERAMSMLGSHQSAPTGPAVAGESGASGYTGVDVRRHTVIRT